MSPDAENLEDTAGTPPAEDPETEVSETPLDADETETEPEGEGEEPEPEGEPDEDEDGEEAEDGEDDSDETPKFASKKERDSWEDLVKKFSHIKSDDDRRRAVADAYWRKARYAKAVRTERDELRNRLTRAEAELSLRTPKEGEAEAPPHPELVRIDAAIASIDAKIQQTQEAQRGRLTKLNELDRQVAVAEDRLKDAYDDDQKARFKDRLDLAKERYDTARELYLGGVERIEDLNEKKEQALGNKDWIQKYQAKQAEDAKQVEQEKAAFKKNFPKFVDGMIKDVADNVGVPKDERTRASLWKHVNRALMVDIRAANVPDISQLNVPGMVENFVREYAEDHDLMRRSAFKKKSEEKLAVSRKVATAGKAPGDRVPASQRPPVPASLLSSSASPKMLSARQKLIRRLGG